jgi:HK97 family phage prohead protease
MQKREFRFGFTPELRGEADSPKITGYAAVFNQEADLGFFREVIKPGAFKRSIDSGADVAALVQHDPAMIIGRSKAGTLTLAEDDKGLRVEITPPDTMVGRDVVTNLRAGNLDKMSFGFFVKGEELKKVNGRWLREVTDVDLFDVSVVTFPAYEGTSVQARSLFPDGDPSVPADEPESIPAEELERMKMRAELAEHD